MFSLFPRCERRGKHTEISGKWGALSGPTIKEKGACVRFHSSRVKNTSAKAKAFIYMVFLFICSRQEVLEQLHQIIWYFQNDFYLTTLMFWTRLLCVNVLKLELNLPSNKHNYEQMFPQHLNLGFHEIPSFFLTLTHRDGGFCFRPAEKQGPRRHFLLLFNDTVIITYHISPPQVLLLVYIFTARFAVLITSSEKQNSPY